MLLIYLCLWCPNSCVYTWLCGLRLGQVFFSWQFPDGLPLREGANDRHWWVPESHGGAARMKRFLCSFVSCPWSHSNSCPTVFSSSQPLTCISLDLSVELAYLALSSSRVILHQSVNSPNHVMSLLSRRIPSEKNSKSSGLVFFPEDPALADLAFPLGFPIGRGDGHEL